MSFHVEAGSVYAVDLTIRYPSRPPWEYFGRARDINTHHRHQHYRTRDNRPARLRNPVDRRRMHQQYRARRRYF
jgi:hypothetical protein